MLLALRSLWEATGGAVRKGAGLLLALQSLVLEPASGDVTFAITGVAANPQIGDVTQVAGTESSGGALQAFRLALQREAERQYRKRHVQFTIADGVAARPRIGKITRVDISPAAATAGVRANARAGELAIVHVDFSIDGAIANASAGQLEEIATNFEINEGTAALPSVAASLAVETTFDLLDEEWIALMLVAA